MPREPLYPHVPKSKEAQFPHRSSAQPQNLGTTITQTEIAELINLYHTAQIPVGYKRYDRLVWAAKEFHKTHPNISETKAYKLVDEATRQSLPQTESRQQKYVIIKNTGATLSWDAWVRELQGYQKRGEIPPEVEYPPLQCKYCGVPVPKEHLKGIQPEIWARYHVKGHRDAVKELAAKKLPWSAGLIPAVGGEPELSASTINLLAKTEGDPIRKFCCRQCGECAAKELLEEGRFPDRMNWLRSHYFKYHKRQFLEWHKGKKT